MAEIQEMNLPSGKPASEGWASRKIGEFVGKVATPEIMMDLGIVAVSILPGIRIFPRAIGLVGRLGGSSIRPSGTALRTAFTDLAVAARHTEPPGAISALPAGRVPRSLGAAASKDSPADPAGDWAKKLPPLTAGQVDGLYESIVGDPRHKAGTHIARAMSEMGMFPSESHLLDPVLRRYLREEYGKAAQQALHEDPLGLLWGSSAPTQRSAARVSAGTGAGAAGRHATVSEASASRPVEAGVEPAIEAGRDFNAQPRIHPDVVGMHWTFAGTQELKVYYSNGTHFVERPGQPVQRSGMLRFSEAYNHGPLMPPNGWDIPRSLEVANGGVVVTHPGSAPDPIRTKVRFPERLGNEAFLKVLDRIHRDQQMPVAHPPRFPGNNLHRDSEFVPRAEIVAFMNKGGELHPISVLTDLTIVQGMAGSPKRSLGGFAVDLYNRAAEQLLRYGKLGPGFYGTTRDLERLFAEKVANILPEFRESWSARHTFTGQDTKMLREMTGGPMGAEERRIRGTTSEEIRAEIDQVLREIRAQDLGELLYTPLIRHYKEGAAARHIMERVIHDGVENGAHGSNYMGRYRDYDGKSRNYSRLLPETTALIAETPGILDPLVLLTEELLSNTAREVSRVRGELGFRGRSVAPQTVEFVARSLRAVGLTRQYVLKLPDCAHLSEILNATITRALELCDAALK